ncbi:MAG: hypothetical protein IH934_03035 [Nanoarchaeota archaeon]|nr:hypothetical protein [Nanoarchaeota archaeon]
MTPVTQMRVIYFERNDATELDVHLLSSASIFFIPDENYVLTVNKHGTGGRWGNILDEAQAITRRDTPTDPNVTYSNIREFDYDALRLRMLMQDRTLRDELGTKIRIETEELLNYHSEIPSHTTPEQPMRVIYFERCGKGNATGFYVPDQDLFQNGLLYAERNRFVDGLTQKDILNVVRSVAQGGKAPQKYRNVSEFDYDAPKIMTLLQDTKSKADLDQKVASEIKELLKRVE